MTALRNLLSISLAFALVAVCAHAQEDTVVTKDGKRSQGKIDSYDYDYVKLLSRDGKATTKVKTSDVENVIWQSPLPKDFQEAQATANGAFSSGNYDDAIAKLQAVVDNAKTREPLRQEAYFMLTQVLMGAGKHEEAAQAAQAMLKKFPSSRYVEQAHDVVVRSLIAAQKPADAVSFTKTEEERVGKFTDARALTDGLKLMRARAQTRAGQGADAKADLSTLANTGGPKADEARVMLGDVLLREKNAAEAEKNFREALKTSTVTQVRAAAYNGLGEILYQQGIASKKPETLRDALFSFLRTVVQFPPSASDSTEHHETALLQAGMCFQSLGELEKPGDAQTRLMARARELYRRLLSDYKTSAHAAEATRRLEKLQG
jgi:tetratricopeptide (TPR) repeat protein